MGISRRAVLRASTLGATLAATARGAAASAAAAPRKVATLRAVIRRGRPGAKGYAPLVTAPGEAHVVRTDLGVRAKPGRAARRTGILAFVQISDVHIVDAQSPCRVEWTDRNDDPAPSPAVGIFVSAYRAHEMLSAHIADAMVREINAIGTGPVSGLPLALTIQTGDNSDNSQLNEVRWNIDLLDGGRVRADSGDLTTYEGVCDDDAASYDRTYWHPHPPPSGKSDDAAKTMYGFPTVPGLLDAARRPFRAQGLDMPWYACFGNHDGLVQGNFPAETLQLNAIATGPLKIISPPAGFSPAQLTNALAAGNVGAFLSSLVLGPGVRTVTADPERRLIARAGIVEEHFTTSGLPKGHGFTARNRRDGTAYYAFEKSGCRFIVLDTVNPNGYADGSIDATQMEWLRDQMTQSKGGIAMVFSHHTSGTMNNPLVATGGDPTPRVTGDEVLALLLKHWEVVAWINGHTHRSEILFHQRPKGGGIWEINTASHIDWPQQSRIIELLDNHDGTLSIFTTVVDHAGPVEKLGDHDLATPTGLAGLARELAANDWQDRSDTGLGERRDRNVELLVRMPLRYRR